MLSDFKYIFTWWLSLFFLSFLSLPLIFLLFKKFWDKGYIFAKTCSIFILSYFLLVLGIFKITTFTLPCIYFIITIYAAINFYLFIKNKLYFKSLFKKHWRIFLFEEILFFLILMLWSYVRGFAPDIEGLEKFMDWGFVNSALRSQYFPPADMWYAGQSINYYYFGHLVFAFLTKFSGIASAITYNLSIATVCGLTFVSGFSLTSNLIYSTLKKPIFRLYFVGGLLSAFLLTFGGNLHLIYKISKTMIEEKQNLQSASASYWYPDATRFIGFDPDTTDKTIHEFPMYSFVVADLHGHMNDIPLVIFFMAFLFVSLTSISNLKSYFFLPAGFLLSLAYMTNAWDFAVYGLLFAIASFLVTKKFWPTIFSGLLTIAFWFLFTLPFSLNFTPMAEGLELSDARSPLYQLFVLYGGFWLISLPFISYFFKNFRSKKILSTDYFVLAILITATILIIIPEIFYIKDIYVFDYRRANTMFKLVYQAFIMYSLIAGYIFIRLRHSFAYRFLFSLVFIFHLSYSYFATKSYYGLKEYKSLWGLKFLEISYPDNLAAINWLNNNISGQPHIVEAVGDSYTTFNQISMATGLPTIEGWIVHEWLWRGGYDAPAARQNEVEIIYTSVDSREVKSILDKYQIKYIIVGAKEYEKYPDLDPDKFDLVDAKVVFESGQTRIYQLP
ncbi:MAG: DUF2298 domain-containing protein [Candidatus Shapirobacteria bacterium]|nr:DUF2298 domain-containing protein [Candidatus Shapirobacteria bacterium]